MLGLYTNLHQSPAVEPEIATLDLEPFHLLEIAGRRALSGILWILANTVEEHQRELVGCQKSSVREARHSEKTKKNKIAFQESGKDVSNYLKLWQFCVAVCCTTCVIPMLEAVECESTGMTPRSWHMRKNHIYTHVLYTLIYVRVCVIIYIYSLYTHEKIDLTVQLNRPCQFTGLSSTGLERLSQKPWRSHVSG